MTVRYSHQRRLSCESHCLSGLRLYNTDVNFVSDDLEVASKTHATDANTTLNNKCCEFEYVPIEHLEMPRIVT